jgi:hypothetical protein
MIPFTFPCILWLPSITSFKFWIIFCQAIPAVLAWIW